MRQYDMRIFSNSIEESARNQCYTLAKSAAFAGAKIRIMPDVHEGKGCVIGFTASGYSHIIPNVISIDIGCGMRVVELGKIDIDFEKLDYTISACIPSGNTLRSTGIKQIDKETEQLINQLFMPLTPRIQGKAVRGIGTLGGGNHFIEVDQDEENNKYLIIHTGGRSLGVAVCNFYQCLAEEYCKQLSSTIAQDPTKENIHINMKLAYLSESDQANYLHDMRITQEYAELNRKTIADTICSKMGWKQVDVFETVHNYIDFDDNIIRKGSISAQKGKRLLIPLNMRDGCILAQGKGNPEWNYSAPHGAGRCMSRSEAHNRIDVDNYKETMSGIYSTSVCESTLDESPFAYKPAQEIIDAVAETVDIIKIIKPVYNFKAH